MSVPFFLSVTQPKGNFHPGSGDWVKLHHVWSLQQRDSWDDPAHTNTQLNSITHELFFIYREKYYLRTKKAWYNHNVMQGHWFPRKSFYVPLKFLHCIHWTAIHKTPLSGPSEQFLLCGTVRSERPRWEKESLCPNAQWVISGSRAQIHEFCILCWWIEFVFDEQTRSIVYHTSVWMLLKATFPL